MANYYNKQNRRKTSHIGRALCGFFLTCLLILLLILNGFLISLKISFLKDNNINNILENTGFYSAVREVVVDEIYKNTNALGISKEALSDILSEDIISNTAQTITDAVINEENIDLSYLKEDCKNIAQSASDKAVDVIFDNLSDTSKIFDAKTLADNPDLKQFEYNYGINVSDNIIDVMESTFSTTVVDLNNTDKNKVKKVVASAMTEKVYPVIDQTFHKYIYEANDFVNKSVSSINNSYHLNDILKDIEKGAARLFYAIIIISVLIVGILLLELFIYRHSRYRSFRNFSYGMFCSGFVLILFGIYLKFISIDRIFDRLFYEPDYIETILKSYAANITASINSTVIIAGAIYTAIAVFFMAAGSLMKRK